MPEPKREYRTWIDMDFGDGCYRLWLKWPNIVALEKSLGMGVGPIYGALARGRFGDQPGEDFGHPAEAIFNAEIVAETIRHALIGGEHGVVNDVEVKVTPADAKRLLDAYVLPRPLTETWNFAFAAAHAAMVGIPIGEETDEERKPREERETFARKIAALTKSVPVKGRERASGGRGGSSPAAQSG